MDVDILRGSTSIYSHDDMVLNANKINLRSFGSQGQHCTGVLALKLAELEFIKSETGEYPVLLLDDVMSELDATRRDQLLLFIHSGTDSDFYYSNRPGLFSQRKSRSISYSVCWNDSGVIIWDLVKQDRPDLKK